MLLNNITKINSIDKINNHDNIYYIDEIEFIQKKFKMNFVDFKNSDISYEIINHNSKYYFFHFTIFDKILKTHKNPYNNKLLNSNIIDRIYLKNQLNKIVLSLKFHKDKFNFNLLYEEFRNYDQEFIKKLNFYFISYLITQKIKSCNVNENMLFQIASNLSFDVTDKMEKNIVMAVLGYLICSYTAAQ